MKKFSMIAGLLSLCVFAYAQKTEAVDTAIVSKLKAEGLTRSQVMDILGMLTDVFAFTLGFSTSIKQRLLAEANVDRRAALLQEKLSALANHEDAPVANPSGFPPRFSLN